MPSSTLSVAAVDLGAQSGRVGHGAFDGQQLIVTELHRFPNGPTERNGRLEWDVRRLYDATLAGLAAAAKRGGQLNSVGVDSWGVDFGLLDRRGRLLENPVCYRDRRRVAAFEHSLERVPAPELYARTGIQLLPINSIFELVALAREQSPALAQAQDLLLVADLFNYWLSGVRACEITNASTTQLLDWETGLWATDLLARLEVPTHFLPSVLESGCVLGPIARAARAATGLRRANVIAVASHDTASAVAAIPFRRENSIYISSGTWSLVGAELANPVVTMESYESNLTNSRGVAGRTLFLRNVPGLWVLAECQREWSEVGTQFSATELIAMAEDAPALRSFIEPDDARFATPGGMRAKIQAFCAETRQEVPNDPPSIVRCVLESLALKHAAVARSVERAAGIDAAELHLVGGGSANRLLCQFTASAAAIPLLAGPKEATLIGNMLVQLLAIGALNSLSEARELVRQSTHVVTYEPELSSAWIEAQKRYKELTAAAGMSA
jgi:rhamnulokinase